MAVRRRGAGEWQRGEKSDKFLVKIRNLFQWSSRFFYFISDTSYRRPWKRVPFIADVEIGVEGIYFSSLAFSCV